MVEKVRLDMRSKAFDVLTKQTKRRKRGPRENVEFEVGVTKLLYLDNEEEKTR